MRYFVGLLAALQLAGCHHDNGEPQLKSALPVRAATLEPSDASAWSATGVVRARVEVPLSFRVGGQILARRVDSGSRVKAGESLFTLDPRDLELAQDRARAQLGSARAEAENAVSERERARQLLDKKFISPQAYDRSQSLALAATEREAAARAAALQAANMLDYATLRAPAAGVLVDVAAEAKQVVGAGQIVATLAQDGEREVEVSIPEARRGNVPQRATARLGNQSIEARLRELSASADPVTRTFRARYRLPGANVELGTTLRLDFSESQGAEYRVPISALRDDGRGPMLWRIENGQAKPIPVKVLEFDDETARVETRLAAGTQIVALGVQLLHPNEAVRVIGK